MSIFASKRLLIALSIVALASPALLGQTAGERVRYTSLISWPSHATLVGVPEILDELKIAPEQRKAIGDALAGYQKALSDYQQHLAANPFGGEVGRDNRWQQKLREESSKREDAVRAALEENVQRLDQIAAQAAGLGAVITRAELREKLAITDAQLAKARVTLDAAYDEINPRGERRTGSFGGGIGTAANRARFAEKTTPKLLELLTEDQKHRWSAVVGDSVPASLIEKVHATATNRAGRSSFEGFRPMQSTVALVSSPGIAQILLIQEVLDELKLEPPQLASIRALQSEYQQSIASNPPSGANAAESLQKRQSAARKRDEGLRSALTEKAKRVDQIAAQCAGLAAIFTREELRKKFAVSDEQLKKGNEILNSVYAEMNAGAAERTTFWGAAGAEFRDRFAQKATPRLFELLNENQKQQWRDMTGDEIASNILTKIRMAATPGPAFGPRQPTAAQLLQEAQSLERAKDYAGAAAKMKEAIRLAPENDYYYAHASHVDRLAGNYDEGVEHALQAIKLNEKKVGWYYAAVAFNAHAKGDMELARSYCMKVVELGAEAVGQANFDLAKKLLEETKDKN